MRRALLLGAAAIVAVGISISIYRFDAVLAQGSTGGPVFSPANELMRPADYREWMFVTSGLGMSYNPPASPNANPSFTNVYVNPSSYRAFMKTGKWPEQ